MSVEAQLADEVQQSVVERERRVEYGRGGNAVDADPVLTTESSAKESYLHERESPLHLLLRLSGWRCESLEAAGRGR